MTKTTIAAFDFDHTITDCDTLLPFLIFTQGFYTTYLKLALLIPFLLAFCMGILSRQKTKEKILKFFFKGETADILKKQGESFARSSNLKLHMKSAAIERIKWHQKQGHQCILISASIDIYLQPWSKDKGFDRFICSHLAYDKEDKFIGKLEGLNCWGVEKTRRLETLIGPKSNYVLYAYGDSKGDEDLLSLADYAYYRFIPFQ